MSLTRLCPLLTMNVIRWSSVFASIIYPIFFYGLLLILSRLVHFHRHGVGADCLEGPWRRLKISQNTLTQFATCSFRAS